MARGSPLWIVHRTLLSQLFVVGRCLLQCYSWHLVSPLMRWYYDLMSVWCDALWGHIWSYWPSLTPVLSPSPSCPHTVIRSLLWRSICLENWHQNKRERDSSKLVGVHVSVLEQGVLSTDSRGYFSVTGEILIRPNMEMGWRGSPTIQRILIWTPILRYVKYYCYWCICVRLYEW